MRATSEKYRLNSYDGEELPFENYMKLDNTNPAPDEVAKMIKAFDRYMSTKCKLRETTRSNYIYIYDRFVRDTFGKKKIAEVKYSDVLQFYLHLLNVDDLSLGTLDSVKQQLRIFVLW